MIGNGQPRFVIVARLGEVRIGLNSQSERRESNRFA